ncbi:hypothetical protein [Luteolibacter soli]|uniref:ABC transporter permease n=1 Tax=Luteolibacter soli TaxID=3135280 RepID=A0ABU9ATY0_9BACT
MSVSAANPVVPPPAVTPPPVAGQLDEFSDKLSPMLVKELRQGLRGKTFVILFLALQGLLGIVLLSAIGASSDGDSGPAVSKVIFFFFALAALVAQPLRGIGALHHEIKGNTIDLMVLTRLGSWRIVLGKWVAIVSQTGLLLMAIVPYLILRYFFGRMDLFAELLLLGLVFAGSAIFTAITVGLSALPSILVRGLMPLALAVFIGFSIPSITFSHELNGLIRICTLQDKAEAWGLFSTLAVGIYIGWMALAMGASIIAPQAENHSTSRRLVALGMIALLGVIGWIAGTSRDVMAVMLIMVGVPAVALALTEPLELLPPICRPFLRFGNLGKVAGRILYPGWASGVLFTGLLMTGTILVYLSRPNTDINPNLPIVKLLMTLGTLLLPALIIRVLASRARSPLGVYILIGVLLCAAAIALVLIMTETDNDGYVWFFSWIPPVQMVVVDFLYRNHPSSTTIADLSGLVQVGVITCSAYFVLLLFFALKNFSAIREVEQEAEGHAPKPTS